jgi:hypothetical protein
LRRRDLLALGFGVLGGALATRETRAAKPATLLVAAV